MENELPPRPPEEGDLIALCRELNRLGARYVVIGGLAVIYHGFLRATEDIDLLVDPAPSNQARILEALEILPDKAVRELAPDDIGTYSVVRVVDEIVIDLMVSAAGITFDDIEQQIEWREIGAVRIPIASAADLLRMKETLRPKDAADAAYLREKLAEEKGGKSS